MILHFIRVWFWGKVGKHLGVARRLLFRTGRGRRLVCHFLFLGGAGEGLDSTYDMIGNDIILFVHISH